MAKLILTLDAGQKKVFEIVKEQTIIGRRPDCDIQIDNKAVSGRHAKILTISSDSFLEDLGSMNGTYINAERVQKKALNDGDIVVIGQHELQYVNEEAQAADDEFEKTVVIRPNSAGAAAAMAKIAAQAGAATMTGSAPAQPQQKVGRLTILNGPTAGRFMNLTKTIVTLGKPGKQVAAISRRSQGYFLTHIESDGDGKRYPLVNGHPIGPRAHPLKDKDKVEVAGIGLQFTVSN